MLVQVLKLVQAVAQARHTVCRMLEHSAAAAAATSGGGSLLWRLTAGLLDAREAESRDGEQSLRKTSEMLERALENLCQIFKVGQVPAPPASLLDPSPPTPDGVPLPLQLNQGQVSQLLSGLDWSQDPGTSRQLPDCVQGENGLELTELGRQQVRAPRFS